MCIFSGDVKEVSKTRILISKIFPAKIITGKDGNGRMRKFKQPNGLPLQLTVYSNSVKLSRTPFDSNGRPNTAMILPFPMKPGRKNRVRVLNMEQYEGIFEDLNSMFPFYVSNSSESKSYNLSDDAQKLEVYNIGSYQVSLVPGIKSFDKLQHNTFGLVPDVKELLKQYYSHNYGFVVCILRNNAKFHPFAYVHELRKDQKLFVPTRHFHGVNSGQSISDSSFMKFHEQGDTKEDISDAWGYTKSTPIDMEDLDPIEAELLRKTNDVSRGSRGLRTESDPDSSGNVDDYYHDVLMMEDKWIRHQVKRRDPATTEHSVIDWDHEIYIINHPTALKTPLINKPGFRAEFPDKDKLAHIYNYVMMNNFPKEISFGGIQSLFRIKITQLYQGNHDMFL